MKGCLLPFRNESARPAAIYATARIVQLTFYFCIPYPQPPIRHSNRFSYFSCKLAISIASNYSHRLFQPSQRLLTEMTLSPF